MNPFDMTRPPTNYYAPSLLQVTAVSDYTRQQPVGYFSLPAEIRIMIMELVLTPGEVLLHATRPIKRNRKPFLLRGTLRRVMNTVSKCSDKDSKLLRVLQPPGFQLLATCKQACAEGHAVFYSSNVFYLPPGPLEETHRCWQTLQPQHRAMIKKVGILMSLKDLTPAVFEQVHHDVREHCGGSMMDRIIFSHGMEWSYFVEKRLSDIWKEKMDFVLAHLEGLTLLKIVTGEELGQYDVENLERDVEFFEEEDGDMLEIFNLLGRAAHLVREDVEGRVSRAGWKTFGAMINKGRLQL